jgi:hypothetical protein
MQFFRRPRLFTALMLLISVLFMQLAAAAHACPDINPAPAMAAHAGMDGMDECMEADDDGALSALCDNHCQPGSQSLNKPPLPDVPPFLAIALVSSGVATPISTDLSQTRADELFSTRINAPPLSIRNCCFRI